MRRSGAEEIATVVVCSARGPLLEAICGRLAEDGWAPLPASTAWAASRLCRYGKADVLVLDLDLPDAPSPDLLRARVEEVEFPDLGVLALIGRGRDPRVLTDDPGLAVDDYLRRPFTFDDLRRRLEAIVRRRHSRDDDVVRLGDLVVDPPRRRVTVGEREVRLARREFLLLRILAEDPTRVFSKDELLWAVWGLRQGPGRTRTLESHASRLRRKLDPEGRRFVVNCWGVGYRLLDSPDDGPAGEAGGEAR